MKTDFRDLVGILFLLALCPSLFLLQGCKGKRENTPIGFGSMEVRYLIPSYYTPDQEHSRIEEDVFSSAVWHVRIGSSDLEEITEKRYPEKYKRLALEHHETGEKKFTINPYVAGPLKPHTTGIEKIQVFMRRNGESKFTDVSAHYDIEYHSYKDAILGAYKDPYPSATKKNIAELTKEDLLWIPLVGCKIINMNNAYLVKEAGDELKIVVKPREAEDIVLSYVVKKHCQC